MALSLPPSPASLQLPDTVKYATVQTTAYLNDDTRVDVGGNTRVTVAGDTRIVWAAYMVYAQVLGQVPKMTRIMSLPE